jgi:hypothetical protein
MNQQLAASAEQFFRAFEVNSAKGNMEAVVAQFAEVFMAAGPQGEKVVRASDFAAALPRRKQMLASLGCPAASLVSLRPAQLDQRYVMANAKWSFEFGGGQSAGRPEEVHVHCQHCGRAIQDRLLPGPSGHRGDSQGTRNVARMTALNSRQREPVATT